MSFDTTFDYSAAVTGLTAEKDAANAKLNILTSERTLLLSATLYADNPLVASRLIQLGIDIEREALTIADITSVLVEITEVNALAGQTKADLYYFYTIVDTTKQDFMARILYNHDRALNDQKIADLRADTITPAPTKTLIAKLLYNEYPIMPDKISTIMGIFRYVRT